MKTFQGKRCAGGCRVTVDGVRLPLRVDLRNHSPTGFEWGYGGSGPAQLALAILADVLGDEVALAVYQYFAFDVICALTRDEWQLTDSDVMAWIDRYSADLM